MCDRDKERKLIESGIVPAEEWLEFRGDSRVSDCDETDPSKFLVSDVVLPEGLNELMADRHKAESQVLLEQADRVRELVMEAQQKRRDEQK